MSFPSLKKEIIKSHLNIELVGDSVIILVTPGGIISGKPLLKSDTEHVVEYEGFLKSVFEDYNANYGAPENEVLCGDDGFFVLTDVTIQNSLSSTKMPYLTLFYDQIIGVYIGGLQP